MHWKPSNKKSGRNTVPWTEAIPNEDIVMHFVWKQKEGKRPQLLPKSLQHWKKCTNNKQPTIFFNQYCKILVMNMNFFFHLLNIKWFTTFLDYWDNLHKLLTYRSVKHSCINKLLTKLLQMVCSHWNQKGFFLGMYVNTIPWNYTMLELRLT